MANNENTGEILKTSPGAINFQTGLEYKVSFDYQTTYADQFRIRLGHDVLTDDGFTAVNTVTDVLGEERETTRYSTEFNASECGVPYVAIDKLAGQNTQHNMTIHGLRVTDIGEADSDACLSGGIQAPAAVQSGDDTVTGYNEAVTDVTHALVVPEGWTAVVATEGATTLAFGETSTQTWTLQSPADITDVIESTLAFTGSGTVNGMVSTVKDSVMVRVTLPLAPGEYYLSDMQDKVKGSPTNGWGPVEWDMSNGNTGAGDGGPLKLGGETFPKGIGAHANSTVDFDLSGLECTKFQATVGVDDSRGSQGSVQFAVYGDGTIIGEQTAVLKGGGTPVALDMDITGVDTLSLRLTDGDNGNGSDHGDGASARVTCGDEEPGLDPKVTATPSVVEPGDTVTLELSGFDPSAASGDAEVHIGDDLVANAEIDADGNGTTTVEVPADAAEGTLEMIVAQPEAGIDPVTVSVTVKTAVDPSPDPSVEPSVQPSVEPSVEPTKKPTSKPTVKPFRPQDVYTTPRHHTVNGRQWFTKCEPYSATFRCWTSIWLTQVDHLGGNKFQSTTVGTSTT